jgi:CRP/FNR family transcriptional regulator, cyclic AMP receptor protein
MGVKFLSRATFEEFAREHPEVYNNLVKVLATRLRITDETVAAGSFLSLKGRVARTLLELAEDFGRNVGSGRVVIHQKIGRSDLGAMTGIARENLSRVFNDWRRRKLVSRLSGYYCLGVSLAGWPIPIERTKLSAPQCSIKNTFA